MDDPFGDDFEELYELLPKAKKPYRSARATVTHTVDGCLAKEANRRFGGREPGMGVIGKPSPPEPEDFYDEYEDPEE